MATIQIQVSKLYVPCLRRSILQPSTSVGRIMCAQKSSDVCKRGGVYQVSVEESHRFIRHAMMKLCAQPEDACTMADHLIEADKRGFLTHGLARVSKYVADIEDKVVNPKARPYLLTETRATAWIHGNNALGPVVGKFAMQTAIDKAKDVGVGFVSVRGSNHFGICGYYMLMAIKQNMIGMCATNSSPLMLPTCAQKTALGTNPIGFGAAGDECNKFVLDAAATKVALGKIEQKKLLGEDMPDDWAVDKKFRPTTKPAEALRANALLPAGGYKGYGLAAAIDVLSGVLGGGNYATKIPDWGRTKDSKPNDLGHFFLAIDPCRFAPGFDVRMQDLLNSLRQTAPMCDDSPVRVAGDMEEMHVCKVMEKGLPYSESLLKITCSIAKHLNIEPIKIMTEEKVDKEEESSAKLVRKEECKPPKTDVCPEKEKEEAEEKESKCCQKEKKESKCDKDEKKESKCKKVAKKESKCDEAEKKESKCKKAAKKESKCDKDEKKESECDKADKKESECGKTEEKDNECMKKDDKEKDC